MSARQHGHGKLNIATQNGQMRIEISPHQSGADAGHQLPIIMCHNVSNTEAMLVNGTVGRPPRRVVALLLTTSGALSFFAMMAPARSDEPCEKVQAPRQVEALAEARRYLLSIWLEIGANYYAGYRMKSPPPNPFDRTIPKVPMEKQVETGFIWVGGLSCQVLGGSQGDDDVIVTFRAGAASFAEVGERWMPPLLNRPLTRLVMSKRGPVWAVREDRGEASILSPEDDLRQPSRTELPARDSKLGIPCLPEQTWQQKRCVAAKLTGGRQRK